MKFKFKVQQYQTDAVESVVNVFNGQKNEKNLKYKRDLGDEELYQPTQVAFDGNGYADPLDDIGYKNNEISLTDEELLKNIRNIQQHNNIKLSDKLIKSIGKCSLDVEMETGTGKTYVYIKTMFELNKRYGWSKFIVVVPSIAIREGVYKSLDTMSDHFMEHYGKKARFFVYDSSNLNQLDSFSSNSGINVMIINTQAFATSLKEGGKNKDSRIIYSKRDEFASRRPIDVIAANRPILILDEPQKMGGDVTQKSLHNFNPLFSINYSATHKNEHNMVYVLDALEAYNQKLVKKIEVKGFEVKHLGGTDSYMYLEQIVLSSNKPPMAKIEIEYSQKTNIVRKTFKLGVNDDLYYKSNELMQYKGYIITDIDPNTGRVIFMNGKVIDTGDVVGDVSEQDMRRIQIRETILSHFQKEEKLYNKGIKTLSLFFIDEVAKYRQYDEDGNELLGEYGKIFEEEYIDVLNKYKTMENTPYQKYLNDMCSEVNEVHRGYFSIDKKGHSIDSKLKRGSESSDDISAYDLILKNKERLLSFDEPTRFIFSHSALREGWDNPNVFQICTLKHSDSQTGKRQEVGRGLRICVDQQGNRMDYQTVEDEIHNINKLTVVASESYATFVADLQNDIKTVLYDRPSKATMEYFEGKTIKVGNESVILDAYQAKAIYRYLLKNDYIDDDDNVTQQYKNEKANNDLAPLPLDLKGMEDGVHKLIQAIFDDSVLNEMIEKGNKPDVVENPLNPNFYKKEFQTLWNYINHKYAYRVDFDSDELIEKSVDVLNKELYVAKLQYTATTGQQKTDMNLYEIERGASFTTSKSQTKTLNNTHSSSVKYDLIGKIAKETTLTRKTVASILKGIKEEKLYGFKYNPEEFIRNVSKIINEQKSTVIVDHISYNIIEGKYDNDIFTVEKSSESYDKAFKATKHIQDYVFTDGYVEQSVERKFAQDLDIADEVCVYAKLPRGFKIPTPVGNYAPDWAIAFYEGTVKHIYFVAETKGSMSSMDISEIEKNKINCARKLFNEISTSKVKYEQVSNYDQLMQVIGK